MIRAKTVRIAATLVSSVPSPRLRPSRAGLFRFVAPDQLDGPPCSQFRTVGRERAPICPTRHAWRTARHGDCHAMTGGGEACGYYL